MAEDHMVDLIPVTPPTLDHLRDAIAALIQDVAELTPKEDITLENYDSFSDGYIKCIEAMRNAAVMAFNYVASETAVSGFQASVAALQAYGMMMHIDGPFMFLQLRDAMYPQSNPVDRVKEWLGKEESRQWLREKVTERMAESSMDSVHPHVMEHWQAILRGHYPRSVE